MNIVGRQPVGDSSAEFDPIGRCIITDEVVLVIEVWTTPVEVKLVNTDIALINHVLEGYFGLGKVSKTDDW